MDILIKKKFYTLNKYISDCNSCILTKRSLFDVKLKYSYIILNCVKIAELKNTIRNLEYLTLYILLNSLHILTYTL